MAGERPLPEVFREIRKMKPVDDQFNSFLDVFVGSGLPEVFKVWNDGLSKVNDLFRHRSEYFFIGVVDQFEQSGYFSCFFHSTRYYFFLASTFTGDFFAAVFFVAVFLAEAFFAVVFLAAVFFDAFLANAPGTCFSIIFFTSSNDNAASSSGVYFSPSAFLPSFSIFL